MPSEIATDENQHPAPSEGENSPSTPAVERPGVRKGRRMGMGVMLGRRWRRRTRWLFRFLIFVPLLVILAALLLIRSPLVGYAVRRQIEAAVGCEATTAASFVMFDGRVVLRDLSLRIPGLKGPEAEFLHVARAEIDADWSGALTGSVKPKAIRLYAPTFRLSSSPDGTELNIEGLNPTDPDAMAGDQPLRIDVHSGLLELGESSPEGYTVLRRIGISGEVVPEEESGSYRVRFRELTSAEEVGKVGMVLRGRADLPSSIATMELLNVDLSSWEGSSVPRFIRDVWDQLQIKGRIASTKIAYYPNTGTTAEIKLDDVSMNAIVPSEYPTGAPSKPLSLRGVHGTINISPVGIRADVAGVVEDQKRQSRVILVTHDLTTDAALECTIISRGFQLEKDPQFLHFVPPVVAERLANFSNPTAVVDANVVIRRAAPQNGVAAPFRVEGWLTFEHGTAAFDRVPYPFTNMTGQVRFDDEGIDILRIRGDGPSGAQLLARGRIAPPNDEAAVEVEVKVRNAPLDETFMKSLPASRAEAIDFLFNRARYEELLAAGLVSRPGEATGAPEFGLGGRMDLDILVQSPEGKESPWTYQVDVRIPKAGVLTRAFPLPIAARDVRLRLTEREASLVAGEFQGLRGGSVDVATRVELEVDGEPVIRPSATIDADDIPIDDLLLHAIEYASGGAGEQPALGSLPKPAELLRALRLEGAVDCRAAITTTPEESIAFDIGVNFEGLTARPAPEGAEPMLALTGGAGSIRLTNTRVEAPHISATLRALEGASEFWSGIAPDAELGWLAVKLEADLSGLDTSLVSVAADGSRSQLSLDSLRATLDATSLELGAPFEQSIAAVSPALAQRIAELRDARMPTGRISASVTADKPDAGAPLALTTRVTAGENVGFNAGGERLETSLLSGAVVLDSRHALAAKFEDCMIDVGVGSLERSPVHLDGLILLEPLEPGQSLPADSRLSITGKDIPVECPGVALILRHVATPEDAAAIREANPSGRFDASVSIPSHALVDDSEGVFDGVSAVIEPRTLRFDFEGTRVVVNSFDGRIRIEGGGIDVDGLVASGDEWTVGIDGRWEREGEGRGVFSARLDLVADSLTPGVRAILPAGLREELDGINLAIDGPLLSSGTRIDYRTGGGESSVIGQLSFSGASLDVGAPLTDAEGRLWLRATRPAGAHWSFALDFEADRVLAAGLEMTGLRSRMIVGRTPGELILEDLSADCYAGRVTAQARIFDRTPDTGAAESDDNDGSAYEAEITMAGVCFAPVLAALDAARYRPEGLEPAPMTSALSADPRRGRLDGTLAISGITGQPASRSGAGSVRIAGGDVVEMPLVLALVQLSNLQLPSEDRLDFLQALFRVRQDQVIFDQIDLLSSSVTIAGRGTMSWPGQELDLRFNSRAGNRVPLVSDVFEAVRDEIATTRIRGPLSSPRVGPESLMGTRELIGNMVGGPTSPRRPTGLPDSRAERKRHLGLVAYPPMPRAGEE